MWLLLRPTYFVDVLLKLLLSHAVPVQSCRKECSDDMAKNKGYRKQKWRIHFFSRVSTISSQATHCPRQARHVLFKIGRR